MSSDYADRPSRDSEPDDRAASTETSDRASDKAVEEVMNKYEETRKGQALDLAGVLQDIKEKEQDAIPCTDVPSDYGAPDKNHATADTLDIITVAAEAIRGILVRRHQDKE